MHKSRFSGLGLLRLAGLAVFDLLVMVGAVYLALYLRHFRPVAQEYLFDMLLAFSPVFLLWLAVFYASNLYSYGLWSYSLVFFKNLLQSLALCFLFAAFFFYISMGVKFAPKTILVLAVGLLGFVEAVLRPQLMRLIAFHTKRKVVIIGKGPDVRQLADALERHPYSVYHLAAVLKPDRFGLSDVQLLIKSGSVDDIVLSDDLHGEQLIGTDLFDLLKYSVDYHFLSDFYEANMQRIPLADINDFWVLESLGNSRGRRYDTVKRIGDILISGFLLVALLPVILLVALLVRLSSPGPVLFRQQRLGLHGRTFTILKFRTMKVDGNNGDPTRQGDSRITKFGRFFRRSRLDELPQLVNVIRGEMSLIGPRPERPELAEELERAVPFYRQRLLVRPGISGWDQVSGEYHSPSVEDTHKKLQFDLYYIKYRSFFLDTKISFKTLTTVLSRAGV